MKSALIGYTGFVGGNLLEKMNFTHQYNSKNIQEIKHKEFDFLICAGIPAEMFISNSNPEQDKKNIQNILDILATVKVKTAVLISTVAVYSQPVIADENSTSFDLNTPYGKHRRMAEEQFIEMFPKHLIVRLPALFGRKIKKNFLCDIINPTPVFLKKEKLIELSEQENILKEYYSFNDSKNMYEFQKDLAINNNKLQEINNIFNKLNFTSLQFTHADSRFQFYNLHNLHHDIQKALENNISILNICSEPITPREIIKTLFDKEFNFTSARKFSYDIQSLYASLWDNTKYLYNKEQVITDLKLFFIENGVLL
ncbi:Nucleoside-diphosphate-sugar epimerase [Brevinema andersonii]|uniref:Nucleoside-diphosphate-sugar epimerase n=1 Tax=Brevinema andersonii TaxID=34097 RepID=A0A1I1EZR0_BREAD|nr:NAD-dependent epimerase/dehydratase family protein [Brevinema andersonii]SFB92554.1 Nucleoside-diphosphate-sugar epimerase [Brevinema andersonii]